MTLVTIGEAVGWICTRDAGHVQQMSNLERRDRLRAAVQKYLGGSPLEKRVRLDGLLRVGGGEYATAQHALVGQQVAIMMGFMPVLAYGSLSHEAVLVLASELVSLDLRACEDGTLLRTSGNGGEPIGPA